MVNKDEIIKRQIGIFREVSDDLATRLEKATGVQGYGGIAGLRFNGSHNGMAKDQKLRAANGQSDLLKVRDVSNGAPVAGSHQAVLNGANGTNGAN